VVIAPLAALGVNLIAIAVLPGLVAARKRWIRRRPGAFKRAVRTVQGEVSGLASKWHRGHGRWVRDVLVWEEAPFLLRSTFVPADPWPARTPRPRRAR
jgi:hypothetical protein